MNWFVNRLRTEEKARCNCGSVVIIALQRCLYTIDIGMPRTFGREIAPCLEREMKDRNQ